MAEHSFVEGVCRYCGASYRADDVQRTCLSHGERKALVRPIPVSVLAEVDPIYQRIQELRRERDAQLAQTTLIE